MIVVCRVIKITRVPMRSCSNEKWCSSREESCARVQTWRLDREITEQIITQDVSLWLIIPFLFFLWNQRWKPTLRMPFLQGMDLEDVEIDMFIDPSGNLRRRLERLTQLQS